MPDRRRGLVLTGAVLLVFAVSGCLGIDPGQKRSSGRSSEPTSAGTSSTVDPTTSTPPPRPVPAPAVGVCHRLTYRDIGRFSNATRKVACTTAYTSYTYAVNRLPRSLKGPLDAAPVQNAAQASCQRSYVDFIGGSATARATTRITPTYFLPGAQAFANGTRWVRCDLVALLEPGQLATLPGALHRILDNKSVASRYAVCSRGRPGEAKSALVMCTQAHTYRAVSALLLGGSAVPSPAQLAEPKATCRRLVASLLGVDGGFSFVFTYPDRQQWNDGQHYGLCWNAQAT